MTLEQFKDKIKNICLAHKDIKKFDYGSEYNKDEDNDSIYPMAFLELPYVYDYELDNTMDSFSIALDILIATNNDDVESDHFAISISKEIADVILLYINNEVDDFKIESASGLSTREYTDDNVAGWRLELDILFPRENCDAFDYNDYFNF